MMENTEKKYYERSYKLALENTKYNSEGKAVITFRWWRAWRKRMGRCIWTITERKIALVYTWSQQCNRDIKCEVRNKIGIYIMSRGIGAHANLILEDEQTVIYEYGGYNLNNSEYKNEIGRASCRERV